MPRAYGFSECKLDICHFATGGDGFECNMHIVGRTMIKTIPSPRLHAEIHQERNRNKKIRA